MTNPITHKHCKDCEARVCVAKTNMSPLCKMCTEKKCCINSGRCNNMFPTITRNGKTYCLGHWKAICSKGCRICNSRERLKFEMDRYAYCMHCRPTFNGIKSQFIKESGLPIDICVNIFSTARGFKLWR